MPLTASLIRATDEHTAALDAWMRSESTWYWGIVLVLSDMGFQLSVEHRKACDRRPVLWNI